MLKLVGRQLRQFSRAAVFNSSSPAAGTGLVKAASDEANAPQQLTAVPEALNGWTEKLRDAGVGDTEFNLKCLVAHVLRHKFNTLPDYQQLHFTPRQLDEFERFCQARCARMPLQHIIGEWDFMDLTLKTAPTVFIPRPETEEFVHKVIEQYRNVSTPVDMLEVGCGSGAMSLAILHALPQVRSTAIERSKAATALSWQNAKLLGLQQRFEVHNHTMEEGKYLPEALADQTYDLIISNPPYVRSLEFQHLQPEVMVYENLNALDGGPDGLRVARLVFDLACVHLRKGGKLWLELGTDHPPLVKTLMNMKYEGRLRFISGYKDQYKRDRFVEIEKV